MPTSRRPLASMLVNTVTPSRRVRAFEEFRASAAAFIIGLPPSA